MSPAAILGASSAIIESTTAAGTINQTTRGDDLVERPATRRAEGGERCHTRLVAVEHDAVVAAAEQPVHHVSAHSAEPDHSNLHAHAPLMSAAARRERFVDRTPQSCQAVG